MESIYIECRNCNTYLKVDKKDYKYKCNKCDYGEDLVVIDKEDIKKRTNSYV
jgi:Zn finger protein HypA/HybF involved in hydrogenase expression